MDDWQHVKALCVSIKGDILRGLGLWKEAAAMLIWSIDLTKALQRVEKKIICGSLSHLSDTFRHMSLEDYQDLAKQYELTTGHPIREAIRYATEAALLCLYTPLFYLKNKVCDQIQFSSFTISLELLIPSKVPLLYLFSSDFWHL